MASMMDWRSVPLPEQSDAQFLLRLSHGIRRLDMDIMAAFTTRRSQTRLVYPPG